MQNSLGGVYFPVFSLLVVGAQFVARAQELYYLASPTSAARLFVSPESDAVMVRATSEAALEAAVTQLVGGAS